MSALPPKDEPRVISEWSIDTLYVHLSRIVEDLDKRLTATLDGKVAILSVSIQAVERTAAAALVAAREEAQKAERNTEVRFAGTNEWRGTVTDMINSSITRKEVEQIVAAMNDKFEQRDKLAVVTTARLGAIEGRGNGLQAGWGILVTVITLAAVVFGVVMALKK